MRLAPLLLVLLAVAGGAAAHGFEPAPPADGTADADGDAVAVAADGAYATCNKTELVMGEGGASMRRLNLQTCPSGTYSCGSCGGCCSCACREVIARRLTVRRPHPILPRPRRPRVCRRLRVLRHLLLQRLHLRLLRRDAVWQRGRRCRRVGARTGAAGGRHLVHVLGGGGTHPGASGDRRRPGPAARVLPLFRHETRGTARDRDASNLPRRLPAHGTTPFRRTMRLRLPRFRGRCESSSSF